MSEIQRYDYDVLGTMSGHSEGDWVKHADHLSATNAMRENQAVLAQEVDKLREALEAARTNIAYAHQPENCGDHCRNNCRDCVLKNALDDIDAALKGEG